MPLSFPISMTKVSLMKQVITRGVSILLAAFFAVLAGPAWPPNTFVYFGSHGKGPNIGFSLAHFDTDTGKLTTPVFLEEAVAPAYFIIRPDGNRLYTCNSSPGSSVSAYAIDPATAKLTLLNQKPSGGGDPSYLSLDATGRFLMVANYLGGSIAVFALEPDGSIGARTAFVQHAAAGADPKNPTSAARTRSASIRRTTSCWWPTWAWTSSSCIVST